MAWLVLLLAGLCECGWAVGLKYVDGLRQPLALLGTVAGLGLSFAGLTFALRSLPVGTAYAVWTGIGAAGTAALGMALLGEAATPLRLASLALVVAGIAGLKLSG